MVLGPVDEVNVAVSEESHGGETTSLGVLVHTLNDEQFVVEIVLAFIRLPRGVVNAVAVPDDTCTKLYKAFSLDVDIILANQG